MRCCMSMTSSKGSAGNSEPKTISIILRKERLVQSLQYLKKTEVSESLTSQYNVCQMFQNPNYNIIIFKMTKLMPGNRVINLLNMRKFVSHALEMSKRNARI